MDRKSLYTVVGVLTLAVLVAVFELGPRTEVDLSISDAKNNQSVRNNATISEMTKKLLDITQDLRKADPAQQDALLEQLIGLARSRQEQMKAIAQSDPDAVVKNTIPSALKKQIPEDAHEFIEDSADLSGELSVVVVEDDSSKALYDYHLSSSGKRTKLNMGGYRENLLTGQKVKVKGTMVGGELSVASDSSSVTITGQATVAGEPAGNKKVAAILFNYTSNTSRPYTVDGVRNGLFTASNSVNNYYIENSLNKYGIIGDVFDYVTVNSSPTSCDYYGLSALADTAAASAYGFNKSSYNNVMYFFPEPPGCAGYWLGEVGGQLSWHFRNDSAFLRHSAHELGHNYGRHHANSYNCSGLTLGSTCTSTEYGDPHSLMGSAGVVKHFTSFHKGYNSSANPTYFSSANIKTVTSNGQFTITPVETTSSGLQSLRVQRGTTGQYIYMTFRQPYGFDNFSTSDPVVNGVSLHLAGDYTSTSQSQLLDASPDGNFSDSSLKAGQTFTDSTYGITISVVSISPAGAVVDVNVPAQPCSMSNPSLSIAPSSITSSPGATSSYSLTLTNNNSSCANATFSIVPTLSSGLVQTPASFNETLTSGESVTRTFMITADPLITTGTKSISQRASNGNYSATASASLVIPTVPGQTETIPPTVTINSPANGSKVSQNTSISVSAADASGIGSINIQIDGTTVRTCSGVTTCSYKWNTRKTSSGAHTIKAIAIDQAATPNRSETSISVTK